LHEVVVLFLGAFQKFLLPQHAPLFALTRFAASPLPPFFTRPVATIFLPDSTILI